MDSDEKIRYMGGFKDNLFDGWGTMFYTPI